MADLKTISVMGVELSVSPRLVASAPVFFAAADMAAAQKAGDDAAIMAAAAAWMRAVLGDQLPRVLADLAAKEEDGCVPVETLSQFCSAVIEACGAKN
jgi:hypothetical protein